MSSILITGGTGYFGRGFTRLMLEQQIFERICVFSRGEARQAEMRHELNDDPRLRFFIGDVRDRARLTRAMGGCEAVVHAAALKRIEVVDYNVIEGVATNVVGTMNVIEAAIDAKVGRAVFLSSDKACNPTTTYGFSKALGEKAWLRAHHYAGPLGTKFAVVRYGNVAGSTGSVIPTWRRALIDGTPVRMSDPGMTRFWMTRAEACDLVARTVRDMQGQEIMIPELPAYALGDLAVAMGIKDAQPMQLSDGEKIHEEMQPGVSSADARRMPVEELVRRLEEVE